LHFTPSLPFAGKAFFLSTPFRPKFVDAAKALFFASREIVNFLDALWWGEYKPLTKEKVALRTSWRLQVDHIHPQLQHLPLFDHPIDHQCDSRVLCNKESQTPSGPEGSSGREPLYVCRGARLSFF
jgi:hypothetical protein